MQDLQQGPSGQVRVLVGLGEPTGTHPAAQLRDAVVDDRFGRHVAHRLVLGVRTGAAGGQQPEEVRLAGPVRAQDGHPLAEPHLEVEGGHQAVVGRRPQLQPLEEFQEASLHTPLEDLGWNDMGPSEDEDEAPRAPDGGAEVVPISGEFAGVAGRPVVVLDQAGLATRLSVSAPRRSAVAQGRRAAFTLRLDPDRHLKLRLAGTVQNRSGQDIVTEALDRYLAATPEIGALAAEVHKRR